MISQLHLENSNVFPRKFFATHEPASVVSSAVKRGKKLEKSPSKPGESFVAKIYTREEGPRRTKHRSPTSTNYTMVGTQVGGVPEQGTEEGAEAGEVAVQTMTSMNNTATMAPPPVAAAARRPHEAGPQGGADKAQRADEGYAERADDAGGTADGTARPTAPVLAFPSFAEEVRRCACMQRQRRGDPVRELTEGVFRVQDGTCSSSFLMFLGELEHEGILTLQRGNVPPRLKGAAVVSRMRSLATLQEMPPAMAGCGGVPWARGAGAETFAWQASVGGRCMTTKWTSGGGDARCGSCRARKASNTRQTRCTSSCGG